MTGHAASLGTREKFLPLLADALNPFSQDRVDSAWEAVPVDLPDINDAAFRELLQTVDLVRRGTGSRGVLLYGERGSGKTHLLNRLRRHVIGNGLGWFSAVPPLTLPERFFRHVLQSVVEDLLRPGSSGLGPLEEALCGLLLEKETFALPVTGGDPAQRLSGLLAQRGPQDSPTLERWFQEIALERSLDPDVMSVLPHYLARTARFEAYSWLLGRPISEEALARLGALANIEDEGRARDVLRTLIRLLPSGGALVLAFDQLEGLQVRAGDLEGLRAYANGVTGVLAASPNVVVVSCVQIYFLELLRGPKAAIHASLFDRLGQDLSGLRLLNRLEARRLVLRRLEVRTDDLQTIRRSLGEVDPFWPLSVGAVEGMVPKPGIPVRELLGKCRGVFEERRRALLSGLEAAVAPMATTLAEATPNPLVASLEAAFQETLDEERKRPTTKLDEGVYADGLLRLVDALNRPGVQAERSAIADVDLILQCGSERLGVSVCHSEQMTSLAARLRRLVEMAEALPRHRLTRLLVLRDLRLPISKGARKAQGYLRELAEKGNLFLRPSAEAYAALSSARRLLASAAAGDLTLAGTPVEMSDLKSWLSKETPAPLATFFDGLVETVDEVAEGGAAKLAKDVPDIGNTAPGGEASVERLVEYLQRVFLATVPDAAAGAGVSSARLLELVFAHPGIAGFLRGAPPVVFLSPDALERS